ncbi:MAG: type II CAAX endopeptidase family protein [Pseudomonadota bacterium]|nr:type II CAAX endopeptidase family protein [Pseudomonadota bacterium]
MNKQIFRSLSKTTLLSIIFFSAVMGIAMTSVALNARWSPNFVWFPIIAIGLLCGTTYWLEKRWDIGLSHAPDLPWVRIYAIGIILTLCGACFSAVNGVFSEKVRSASVFSSDASILFNVFYAFFMPVFAAILAEVTFRGILQSRMQKLLSLWPTLVIVTLINLMAHFPYNSLNELIDNFLGIFFILATWTYLRWLSQSLWPPLIMHGLHNFIFAAVAWFGGPIPHAEFSSATITLIVFLGLATLGLTIFLAKDLHQSLLE